MVSKCLSFILFLAVSAYWFWFSNRTAKDNHLFVCWVLHYSNTVNKLL